MMFGQKADFPDEIVTLNPLAAIDRAASAAPVTAASPSVQSAPTGTPVAGISALAASAGYINTDGNEALVRSENFKIIRAAVYAGMNVTAVIQQTRPQVRKGIEQIGSQIVERDRLNLTQVEQIQITD